MGIPEYYLVGKVAQDGRRVDLGDTLERRSGTSPFVLARKTPSYPIQGQWFDTLISL